MASVASFVQGVESMMENARLQSNFARRECKLPEALDKKLCMEKTLENVDAVT